MTAPVIASEAKDATGSMDEQHLAKALKTSFSIFDNIRKSDVDKCDYRLITLQNQLQVLLVHEDGLDKASAAVDVHVGSFSDPSALPGVAHFLEHLLFMGTSKYPRENDYMEFLAAHGGSSNAFTEDEHTNYFFEVSAEHLEPALDRFAQFFVAPLFNPDGTSREMQAVDSEHKKNVKEDMWRIHQIERTLADHQHPYSNFGTGCSESLNKPDIRETVVQFYQKHYSANIMKAVVYGRDSLEQLATWAEEKFSSIPNHSYSVPSFPERPWTELGRLVKVKTIKEMQTLYIGWQTGGELRNHNQSKPDVYLSHLFGHEGKGSLLSYLKEKDLVLSVSAGFDTHYHGFSFLQISFELTPKGVQNIGEIVLASYHYIALLKDGGPQKWIHDECAMINEISFRFKDKSQSSSSYAYKLANQMQEYPPERILSGSYLLEQWEPQMISSILDSLTVDNFRAMLAYSGFENDSTWSKEKWYGTFFKIEDLDADLMEKCKSPHASDIPQLHLPLPNNFIPKRLEFVGQLAQDSPKRHPDLVDDSTWFKQDDQFGLPKSTFYVLLKNPKIMETAFNSAATALFVEYAKVALSEVAYDATLTGLAYELSSVAEGIEVRVSGFSDKATVLLESVLKVVVGCEINDQTFSSVKDRFVRYLKSLKEEKPIWHANYYASSILQERAIHYNDKLKAIEGAGSDEIVAFVRAALRASSLTILVNGNEVKDSAASARGLVESIVGVVPQFPDYKTLRSVKMPLGETVYKVLEPLPNPNSSIDYYLQIGTLGDAKTRQCTQLFVQIFSEAFFDQLRTKEQLGYMVSQQVRDKGISTGVRMAIQSEKDPHYLELRIEAFLDSIPDKLASMDDAEFGRYKHSLISDLTAKKKKLTQESKAFWEEIAGCRNDFEKNFVNARGVETLSKPDMTEFVNRYIIKDASERRKLVVHVWSETHKTGMSKGYEGRRLISDIAEFIKTCELFDISYPIPK